MDILLTLVYFLTENIIFVGLHHTVKFFQEIVYQVDSKINTLEKVMLSYFLAFIPFRFALEIYFYLLESDLFLEFALTQISTFVSNTM